MSSNGVRDWRIVAARDFNGDGQPDLVWQNDVTWEVVVWYMGGPQGNSFLGWNGLASTDVAGWSVVGAGDFNGDGQPDLVWQNDVTWEVVVWCMGGPQGNSFLGWNRLASTDVAAGASSAPVTSTAMANPMLCGSTRSQGRWPWYLGGAQGTTFQGLDWVSPAGVAGWSVAGTRDFNGDGKPDVVWKNDTTSQVSVWYMGGIQGTTFQGSSWISSAGVPGWKPIP